MSEVRIGVIGYGHFGPHVARCLAATPGARLVAVSDLRSERLARAASVLPEVRTTTDGAELVCDRDLDAIVIATPVTTHAEIALAALRAGKHVLVENPAAANSDEACRMIDEAARRRRVLMVDHTFVYTAAVRKMQEVVAEGIGDLLSYDSVRVNRGRFQSDVDVVWDLAVHDLAIIESVLGMSPRSVSAIGSKPVAGRPASVAYLTLAFDAPLLAHLHLSWLAPVKTRRTVLAGTRRSIVYDDLEMEEKIRVFGSAEVEPVPATSDPVPHGVEAHAPRLDRAEPLSIVAAHFVDCIRTGARPATDGLAGLRTVRVLEAASQSMAQAGRFVELSWSGVGF